MAARNRLPPWHYELRLRNGRQVLIRPIRPDDIAPLQAAFALLEPVQLRERLDPDRGHLGDAAAERLTRPDPRGEFVLVAAEPYNPGEAMIGALARLAVIPGTRDAEFTILVSNYLLGMGLGRQMMQRLVRWSRGKRIERVIGEVAQDNAPMVGLMRSLGFVPDPAGHPHPGLIRVMLDLRKPT